jgi:3-hydroxymyristoyl/3-hydroxydecanoyl-(acyl carrier protein) dehydratase
MNDDRFASVIRAARRNPLWLPEGSTQATEFKRDNIERILPHRSPMLLLDEITAIDLAQQTLSASRRLEEDDTGFAGHFPGNPIYPASLQLEMAGQAGVCLVDFVTRQSCEIPVGQQPRAVRVLKVHHALMLAEVRPGVKLTALARILVCDDLTSIVAVQLLAGEIVASVAILEVCFVDS